MKRIFLALSIISIISVLTTSCSKDDDILDDGNARESFIGTWTVVDQCSKQTYVSFISEDNNNSAQVVISNYANLGFSATAIVAGSSIYIESQEIGNEYQVSGNGRINGEIINWSSHNFETSGESNSCSAIYTKK